MASTPTYRARMLLRLTVMLPRDGSWDPFTYDVPVIEAKVTSNDFNHADTLDVKLNWVDAGVDPRLIANATCEFYLGNADALDRWEPTLKDLRFVGRLVESARHGEGDALEVQCTFHDYTSFFIATKPVRTDAIPTYNDTFRQAWRRLCLATPGAEPLADALEFRGVADLGRIGDVVSDRFARLGARVAVNPSTDAWGMWKDLVGSAGLLTFFELDTCIVCPFSDYYTGDDPPRLIWGKNLLDFSERRNGNFELKGVLVQAVDPLGAQPMREAHFNPLAGVKKKLSARRVKKSKARAQTYDPKEYDAFVVPWASQDALERLAEMIYEVRARQQIEGTATTAEMLVDRASGSGFDLLSLRSGDTIEIRFADTEDANFVKLFGDEARRASYLKRIGYSDAVARVIAANVDYLGGQGNLFFAKSVSTSLSGGKDAGSFRVQVEYCNKLDPSQGAVA